MKKTIATMFLCVVMILMSLTGCGPAAEQLPDPSGTEANYTANAKFDEGAMLNLRGEPFSYENGTVLEYSGFGYVPTEQMSLLLQSEQLGTSWSETDHWERFDFYSEAALLEIAAFYELPEELTEEEFEAIQEKVDAGRGAVAGIFRIREDSKAFKDDKAYMNETFANQKLIATIGKDTYYFAYNESFPNVEYSDADKEALAPLLKELERFMETVCVFPAKDRPVISLSGVDTATADGGSFTVADLAKYELTMVNVWATWCSPCVSEMPELQKVYEKLPEGVNVISICDDGDTEPEAMAEIIATTGVKYPVLIPNEVIKPMLFDAVMAFPTTIFVDGEGNLVGEAMVGVPEGDVVEAYLQAINENLAAVQK